MKLALLFSLLPVLLFLAGCQPRGPQPGPNQELTGADFLPRPGMTITYQFYAHNGQEDGVETEVITAGRDDSEIIGTGSEGTSFRYQIKRGKVYLDYGEGSYLFFDDDLAIGSSWMDKDRVRVEVVDHLQQEYFGRERTCILLKVTYPPRYLDKDQSKPHVEYNLEAEGLGAVEIYELDGDEKYPMQVMTEVKEN